MRKKGAVTLNKLSDDAKEYLSKFCCILDEMIDAMTCAETGRSISENFIVQMIPHHEAAIRMSENVLKYTRCEPLRRIAENIICEQTKGIEKMRKAKEECECENLCRDVRLYLRRNDAIVQKMFGRMGNAQATNNITADFMREMIPHHEGAIEMAENALQYDVCSELKPILCEIISEQRRGVAEMKNLLCAMGC